MIGYDFNGVVDTGKFIPISAADDVIITGNTLSMVNEVMSWLQSHGILCAVYFMPYKNGANNRELTAMWKSEMILRLGCSMYYEDDPLQHLIIEKSCPDCKVIKV